MSERLTYREEELLQVAAPLPVLSSGLRSRVLAAATEASARRTQGRRVLAGVAVIFSLMGWLAWTGPFLPSACQLAATEPNAPESTFPDGSSLEECASGPAPAASPPCSRRERFIAAMEDDWRMVEAEFKSREDFTRRMQM